ncbi:MAG: KEOPS complex subunit Pcc1 [Thermoplasmata archaeon]
MSVEDGWRLAIRTCLPRSADAELLLRSLGPEATREVPRTRARVDRVEPTVVLVEVHARDTGAVRAAANTYLGWIDLTLATLDRARRRSPS